MNKKEIVQEIYRNFRNDCNKNTANCFEFLNYLKNKNELHYLVDMTDLTIVESGYIKQLLEKGDTNVN